MGAPIREGTAGIVERWFHHAANAFAVIGGVALVVLMLITVVSVFWRYALRDPIFGIGDMSSMTLAVVVASGVAYGGVHGVHISVNIISALLGRKALRFADVAIRAAGCLICGYAAYALALKGSCGLACGLNTENMLIPHQPFYYLLAASMALISALLLYQMIAGLGHWGGDDPFEETD
ncbi:TRAP transporter small permease [Microbulbifer sp. S227A]|uniref:TRAP transporter small permease n=1 Tax=Microbulbifer sp. S227A TaxID=3415131 RepID=UPI003C79B882